ncbi:MAG: hypothetical protein RIR69_1559 [Actinomycetota bacterium]|jgi:glycosyltransferase involved in cell wall biosynthesis
MVSENSVAIVMRTYERPIMLARALASVCQQTYKNWTLTVVNNGGDPSRVDDVVNIARLGWPQAVIDVVHLRDRVGMEEASNVALSQSHTDFFAIHDDDDSWKPTFLEKTVRAMQEQPDAVAVVCGVTRIHELARGKTLRPQRAEAFYLDSHHLTFDGMIGNNTFPPIAALFRRSLLDNIGMFDASLPVLGDWEFNLRALTQGQFFYLPERLANYHTRTPDSDVVAENSITVGQDRHRVVKERLIERWHSERTPDGRNKGEVARTAYEMFEKYESERVARRLQPAESFVMRQKRRIVYAAQHPRVGMRAVVRRVRQQVRK